MKKNIYEYLHPVLENIKNTIILQVLYYMVNNFKLLVKSHSSLTIMVCLLFYKRIPI